MREETGETVDAEVTAHQIIHHIFRKLVGVGGGGEREGGREGERERGRASVCVARNTPKTFVDTHILCT